MNTTTSERSPLTPRSAEAPVTLVLNGESSSGKSTLALALRRKLGERSAILAVDDFYRMLSPGCENNWCTFQALNAALFASARELSDSGFSVIVDTVFERQECVEVCRRTLSAANIYLVRLQCPLDELERRELQRKDRPIGLARSQFERVHSFCAYDVVVDTFCGSPDACASRILSIVIAKANAAFPA